MSAIDDFERALATCPDRKFRAAIEILELKRGDPAIAALLTRLRPRLIRVRPSRRLNLRRLFYIPVEDRLTDETGLVPAGMIRRSAAEIAWRRVRQSVPENSWSALAKRLADNSDEAASGNARRGELWTLAADRLGQNLPAESDEILPELREVAILLKHGVKLRNLVDALPPKPIQDLSAEQVAMVRSFVVDGAGGDPDTVSCLLIAIMVRLHVPAVFVTEIAPMRLGLSKKTQPAVVERLQQAALAVMLRDEASLSEGDTADLSGLADKAGDLVTAISAAGLFASARDAPDAVARVRRTAGAVVGRVIDEGSVTIHRGLDEGLDAALALRQETESSLVAMRKCQSFADAVGMDDRLTGALDDIIGTVQDRAAKLASAETTGEMTDDARAQGLYWAMRMLELAGAAEAADTLWRESAALLEPEKPRAAKVS